MTQSNSTLPTSVTIQLKSERFLRLYFILISKATLDELTEMHDEAIDRINTMDKEAINEDLHDYDITFIDKFSTIHYLFMRPSSYCGTLSDIISNLSILFKEDIFNLQNEDSDIKAFLINMLKMPKTAKWKDIFTRKDIFYACELLFNEPDADFNTIMDEMLVDLEFFLDAGYIGTIAKRVIISSSPTKFTKNDESKKSMVATASKGEN